MWNELEKLFYAAQESPLAKLVNSATHNSVAGSGETFTYETMQTSVTSIPKYHLKRKLVQHFVWSFLM
jgi:hypothetical protein